MSFASTAIQVLLLMAYAVPGFLFVKCKTLNASHIAPFSKVLVYFCQPCLQLYAFQTATCSASLLREMGLFFVFCTAVEALVLIAAILLIPDKGESRRRVCSVACVLGNVGFIGIPLLQALLPEDVRASSVALSAIFSLSMNLLGWTCGLYRMTGQRKHIKLKALLTNPAILAFYVAFPLFLLGIKLPAAIASTVELAGRMSTPLCMIALGMRLASTPFGRIITDKYAWLACAGKLVAMPLLSLLAVSFFPVPDYFKATLFLLCCCPTASAVQNFSEIYLPDTEVEGKNTAADSILLSNILCMVTIPVLAMLL